MTGGRGKWEGEGKARGGEGKRERSPQVDRLRHAAGKSSGIIIANKS